MFINNRGLCSLSFDVQDCCLLLAAVRFLPCVRVLDYGGIHKLAAALAESFVVVGIVLVIVAAVTLF